MKESIAEYFSRKRRESVLSDISKLPVIAERIAKLEVTLSDNSNLGLRCVCSDSKCLACKCHATVLELISQFGELCEERALAARMAKYDYDGVA